MLSVSIDLGSSAIKVFFSQGGTPQPLVILPEVAWIEPAQLDEIGINSSVDPEYCAWLQLKEEIVAVGQLAENFGGDDGIVERKQRRAVYKVLAVLGVLREKLQLPTSFGARIAVMLPITEYKDRVDVQVALKLAAGKFAFRGQPLSIDLQTCLMLPEGFGLYAVCKNNLKLKGIDPSTRTIFVLMFGHRNLSVLVYQNGALQTGKSSSNGPGFCEAVKVAASVQGLRASEHSRLLKAMALKETKIRVAGQYEMMDVSEATDVGTASYWRQADSHLRNVLTPVLTDNNSVLAVGGGAAWTMREEVQELFKRMGLDHSVNWASDLQNHLESLLASYPQYQDQPGLAERMVDPFANYQSIAQMSKTSVAA